jgi:hypothetical protein
MLAGAREDRGGRSGEREDRIPFDPSLVGANEHVALTMRALFIGSCVDEPFASVLGLLSAARAKITDAPPSASPEARRTSNSRTSPTSSGYPVHSAVAGTLSPGLYP